MLTPASPRNALFRWSLSVFFPAYNDALSIPALVEDAFRVLDAHVEDFEVIVVNDGSSDHTGEVLEGLRQRYGERLRVVTHESNRGYGGALRSGFAAARKEFVFYTDGDGQYGMGDLPGFLAAMQPGIGMVNGYKLFRQDARHRIWIGSLYNRLARALFRVRLRDIDCDYRLIRRSLLENLELESSGGTICVELVKKLELASVQVLEMPVRHYPRKHGSSQLFRPRSLAVTFRQMLGLYASLMVAPRRGRPSVAVRPL